MTILTSGDGNTPLSPDELADLIPNLATKEELNEFERTNILVAYEWALAPRNIRRQDPLTERYLRDLHYRMFDQTWKWAGIYRTTEKNIGIAHVNIREALGALLGDARYWLEHQTFPPDEIAVRFHHRLVSIHPFANGNGRHSRLMADGLVRRLDRPLFTWGRADIMAQGDFRRRYIDALQVADRNDIAPLLAFARS
ncbi:MAG TPA: mobile mystery protein B [Acidobacteriaceae bacterium]|jgi:Fic-DOC domain mobile mystery protein B|nr:mobile mystery protein B [Acidobacteriaceae bacterium]